MIVALLALVAIVAASNVAAARHGESLVNVASPNRLATGLAYGAVAWTLVAGSALLLMPSYSSTRSTFSSDATSVATTTTHQTLLEHEGHSVLLVLAIPIALAVIGAIAWPRYKRGLRIGTGAVLAFGCVLSAASVGMFYVPAPLALIAAGLKTPREMESR